MKLTVDCVLSHPLLSLPASSALAQLLAAASCTQVDAPLEALVAKAHGLTASPDFPLAAVAAAADNIAVDAAYWLRADPVHLVLQRDSFSLGEPVPLAVDATHAQQIIETLNLHFEQDNFKFFIGASGAWYLRAEQSLAISTSLPSVVAGRNVHTYLPQGEGAAKFRTVFNEIQMLLHEHPANTARASTGNIAVNSVWFSGGGSLPAATQMEHDVDLIYTDAVLNLGLAKLAGIPTCNIPQSFDALLQDAPSPKHIRLVLAEQAALNEAWFAPMLDALKQRKIQKISLNLGFYEYTLRAEIKYSAILLARLLFWRKAKPVQQYLS